ncbi:TPA: RNA-directed DNA polymerase [Vibrio parahaemolyticus]|nr:RNA-directed DNA polymerase [Vibrio parahaemolyticus]
MKAKELLTKGFLPKEFPSLFDSNDMGKTLGINDQILNEKPSVSRPTKTSIPKGAGFRRQIVIPNPKHYTLLCKFLAKKTKEIDRFYKLSKITMSKAIFQQDGSRAITNEHNFESVIQEQILKGFSSRYVLSVDISKFYNTIYTHSIPWALHGKLESKIDKSDNLWGNELDKLVRNMQDGQTLGIPTGPDTSRVISEIIGVALDKIIQTSEPNLNGIRFIDDFFIYSDSAADSESISHKINKALGDFELTSNDNKTSVQKMPAPIESLQLQTIRHYKIRKSAPEQKLDIIHLYNLAIDVHRNNPKDNAFHYFLTKVMPIRIHEDNWPILEAILLQIALCETKTITVVSKILISYKSYGYKIDYEKIKSTFLKVAHIGVSNNFGYEVCWAFWVLSQIEIKVNNDIPDISSVSDPLAIISILTARDKGIYNGALDVNYWQSMMTSDSLHDSSWMMCYEAERRDWLNNQNGLSLIEESSYFNQLNKKDVTFLNMESTINPMKEEELFEETNFEHEIDIFELIYGGD